MVSIRSHNSVDSGNGIGSVYGIAFETTGEEPLGLVVEDICDVKQPAITNRVDLGLGTLSIEGFYFLNYFEWTRITLADGT